MLCTAGNEEFITDVINFGSNERLKEYEKSLFDFQGRIKKKSLSGFAARVETYLGKYFGSQEFFTNLLRYQASSGIGKYFDLTRSEERQKFLSAVSQNEQLASQMPQDNLKSKMYNRIYNYLMRER